jgi:hypothetical protein
LVNKKLKAWLSRVPYPDFLASTLLDFFLILPVCRAKPKRNTETFQPSHEPTEMRLIAVPSGLAHYDREILTRDVIMVPELFCKPADLAIYDKVRKQETGS